jgi:ubiquinone/menaquinone biosynthesis C-methylase UbiE
MNVNEATLVYADEYNRMAEVYDRVVTPRFEPVAKAVAELIAPKPGEMILDLATGTGVLARLLAPRVAPAQLVAIDLADEAIRVASYRAGSAGVRNIRFEMMDVRNIVYHGALFDAIGSNFGIPNIGYDRTFYEVHRLLKPGGRFVFSEWDRTLPASERAFYDLLEAHKTRTPSADLFRVREAVALNRSLPEAKDLRDPPALKKRLESFGFSSVQDTVRTFAVRFADAHDLVSFMTAWGWDEREASEMPQDERDAFETGLAARLRDRIGREGFEETWTIHFTTART